MTGDIPEYLVDQGVDELRYETRKYATRAVAYHDGISRAAKARHEIRPRKPIRTIGTLNGVEVGYIYVAQSRCRTRTKVGMSGSPERRCFAQGIKLIHATPVAGAAALDVETETLRLCGAEQGDGEWTRLPPEVVIGFVAKAMEIVSKRRRVDPNLTEEEARRLRISSCALVGSMS